MDTDKANIENVGNEAARTAMKEIFLELVVVLKKRVSDSAYVDSVTTKLGFVFTSSMLLHSLLLTNFLLRCTNISTLNISSFINTMKVGLSRIKRNNPIYMKSGIHICRITSIKQEYKSILQITCKRIK